MAHYDIFRHHLLNKVPAYGHALWDPNPGNLYPPVEIGDVGYIREGKFRRLFNVFLPANHPSHSNFGVPKYHEQLTLNIGNHIDIGVLAPHSFYSAGITLANDVCFMCPKNQGAVLCLPLEAKREDTVARARFSTWIIKHIDRWFAWARQLELGVDQMEDIILVTGTHRTRSCTNIVFPGGQEKAHTSFGIQSAQPRGRPNSSNIVTINWQFSIARNHGAVLCCGPSGEDLPVDQCIFVRGFRVARKSKILSRPKAPAESNPDRLIPIPASPKYREPLHVLLECIAKGAPHCDMVLVHDDDLAQLDVINSAGGAPLESLPLDALLSRLRSAKPKIHGIPLDTDLPPADDNASDSDATDIVCVASLSSIFYERVVDPQLYGSSRATSESSGTVTPQNVFGTTTSVLVDGYVSQTFQRRQAERYFLNLLKIDKFPKIFPMSFPDREGHNFFIRSSDTGRIKEKPLNSLLWLLDRAIVNRGAVVPQRMWSWHTVTDKHVEEAVLQMPIFFEGVDGRLSLSLDAAAAGQCHTLRDAEQFAPLELTLTNIRIHWLGYKTFKDQIVILDESNVRDPITIAKFAEQIGRSVDKFLRLCQPDPESTDLRREQWRIGPGGVQRSDIIVIGAIHVSEGSWMPILQLNRHIR